MHLSNHCRMVRRSKTLRWHCSCCSLDSNRNPISIRLVKRIAKRREERQWMKEARREIDD